MPLSSASPSLGPSASGASPALLRACGGGLAPVRRVDLADADHRRRHMRQRRKIARGADGPLRGNHRRQALRQHRLQHGHGGGAHAGGALGEARQLQRQHQANDVGRRRLAHAGRMRQHDVGLQPRDVGRLDACAGKLAEAGVDAVDGFALGNDGLDRAGARLHGRPAGRIERDGGAFENGAPFAEADGPAPELDRIGAGGHCPLHTR